MKLTKVAFKNVMELEGSMAFPEGKAVVIYGENKAGKSNIIHALRYAFLNKVIRGAGRASGYDELKLVTGKEIAPPEGMGRISVEFEHDGKQFEIRREIDRYRDNNKILRKEADGFRELDFIKTINKELKAGLLNALFAPDSAMGFNHLNEKNIDAVIRELFKEIGNAKVLTKDFKQRTERLKEEAQVRVTNIERDYDSFVSRLRDGLRETPVNLSSFGRYELGKTAEKISYVSDELKKYIDSIEKGELKEWLKEIRNRAKVAEDIEVLLTDGYQLTTDHFQKMEGISQDKEHLSLLLAELREAKLGSPMPQEPGKFYDSELDERARTIYQKLKQAQTRYSNALSMAQEENIDLKVDNPARIKGDKEKVLKLLTKEVSTDAPRIKADLVKIASESGEESVHGLIPLELMDKDPAFTKLSPEPIPDAPEEHKRQYTEVLRAKIENLRVICEDKDKAESFFNNEFIPGLTKLSGYVTTLMENAREAREKVSNLAKDIHNKLLLFTQEDVKIPRLECQGDLEPFLLTVREIVSHKKSDYQLVIVSKAKNLGIQAGGFNTREIDSLLGKLAEMEKGIPLYKSTWTELARQRRSEWESNDAEYADLTYVPSVVDGLNRTLDAILANAFDEHEVIQGIQDIIVEINGKLMEEGLINSCIEMGEDSLQLSKTTYKDREITHPCGAERSFFSLAALTALATYFKLPVIIDEAANNLDKNHLRHFISLIREFAANYDVQYILSIKETDDFPLDGWVREFADDLQIYKVDYDGKKKYINPVDLYA
jgi:hypothetical protein